MKKIKSFWLRIIATAIFGISLIGCGGGGGSSDDSNSNKTTNTGTFVDSPVEGLKYETATLSGYTDNQGRFQYKDGETITFKIGNLELGSAKGDKLITPLTLTGESDLDNISNKATNIARILQTLDNNSSNGAKLLIPTTLRDLNISDLDLESNTDLNTLLTKAQDITSVNYILKDPIVAKANMKKYINAYTNYKLIQQINYSDMGVKYYLLNLPKESVVIMSQYGINSFEIALRVGNLEATVYDLDMNEVEMHDGKLYAGTYIIKVYHGNKAESTFSINFPSLVDQTSFTKIQNKTYQDTGIHYYSLNMPTDGAIEFTVDPITPAYIFDTDLNLIGDLEGIHNLKKGNYVIYVDHGAIDKVGKSFTAQFF